MNGTRPFRVVTFDADQTLVDFRAAMRAALDRTLIRLREAVPAAHELTVADLAATRDRVADELGPSATMEVIRRAAFARTLEELAAPDEELAAQLTVSYLEQRFLLARLYDDALPALTTLRKRYALGLATNGNSYPERLGLAGYFSFTVFAQDHGVRKPDPAFYRIVLRAAGCEPDEVLHVGNSLVDDVVGSQSVGMKAVWLDRDASDTPSPVPWAVIASLQELPALLA